MNKNCAPPPYPNRSITSQMRQKTKCLCVWTTSTTSRTCTSQTHKGCPSLCPWRMFCTTVLRAPAAKHSLGNTHTHTHIISGTSKSFYFVLFFYFFYVDILHLSTECIVPWTMGLQYHLCLWLHQPSPIKRSWICQNNFLCSRGCRLVVVHYWCPKQTNTFLCITTSTGSS